MKYMYLIYGDPAVEPQYGTAEFDEMMEGYAAFSARLKADGVMLGGEALEGVETATSVKVRSGKAQHMDGPFAETREHLGGFYIVDVADLDTAMKYAAMIPSAAYGTVEVRPLMVFDDPEDDA